MAALAAMVEYILKCFIQWRDDILQIVIEISDTYRETIHNGKTWDNTPAILGLVGPLGQT